MTKWSMIASSVCGSVAFTILIIGSDRVTWGQILAVLLNTVVWQWAAIHAWEYWSAIEIRDRERGHR